MSSKKVYIDLGAHVVAAEAQRDMVAAAVPLAGLRLLSAKFNSAAPPWSVRIRGASTRPRPASRT